MSKKSKQTTVKHKSLKEIDSSISDVFFNGKRVSDNKLKQYVGVIYKHFNLGAPEIIIYTNPAEVHFDEVTDIFDATRIISELSSIWVSDFLKNVDYHDVMRKRIGTGTPEKLFHTIGKIYETLIPKEQLDYQSMYNINNLFFNNYTREFTKNRFFNAFIDFINGGVLWYVFTPKKAYILRTPKSIVNGQPVW